jgi:hypothetical protein
VSAQKASAWSPNSAEILSTEGARSAQRATVCDKATSWRESVVERLNHVCSLPSKWDGYYGRPVDFGTANFALRVLETICHVGKPAPSIVPGPSGDLQIEWHTRAWDVELHVLAPYNVEAWRDSSTSLDDGETLVLAADFTDVRKWIRELSESPIAATPAAA